MQGGCKSLILFNANDNDSHLLFKKILKNWFCTKMVHFVRAWGLWGPRRRVGVQDPNRGCGI